MLNVEFIGGDAIAAVLKAYSDGVQSVLKLQREVMQNRLSGQVLNVRTGNLRRSIHQQVTSSGGLVVGEVNTNVRYGVAHEYGFAGTVNVKASMRQIRQAFGRPLKSPRYVQIRAHSRNVKLPERSFLRSALRDMKPEIEADLQKSIEGALR